MYTVKLDFDETYFGFMKDRLMRANDMIKELNKFSNKYFWNLLALNATERDLIQNNLNILKNYIHDICSDYSNLDFTYEQFDVFFKFVIECKKTFQEFDKILNRKRLLSPPSRSLFTL